MIHATTTSYRLSVRLLASLCLVSVMIMTHLTVSVSADDRDPITCGSTLKLVHDSSLHNLHSHAIAYGSGSGQHSVTAHGAKDDQQSLWLVKEGQGETVCEVGSPVRCGDTVQLQHVATGKNLHSHHFKSPISNNQEVSGFGEDGRGDRGDDWEVLCSGKKNFWERDAKVQLKHSVTGKFLQANSQFKFDQRNCGQQCPIMDQLEVAAVSPSKSPNTYWRSGQGVFFPPLAATAAAIDKEL